MEKTVLKDKYTSEEECKNDVARFNESKNVDEEMRYCSYYDETLHKRMYVPCSVAYFYAWRNMLAEERRKNDLETRCFVPSERYSYMKKCSEDCANCPYGKSHREGTSLSLQEFGNENEHDNLSAEHDDLLDEIIATERRAALISEVNKLDAESRSILLLFNKGLTDAEIGESLGLKRSTVQYKKARLFEELRKRLSDF